MLRELNERAIPIEEVNEAVHEPKSGKAPGLDGFSAGFPDFRSRFPIFYDELGHGNLVRT